MIPRWPPFFLLVLLVPHVSSQALSLNDIITRALSLVSPFFDSSRPLQNDAVVRKQMAPSPTDRQESSILGSRHFTPLDDLPFCRGNSRICQFISCSAENFKKDPTFGNIQLGAQILGDTKLRQAISSNPEAIDSVCKEQGMDEDQCKLFSRGFQFIDKVITTIEEPKEKENKHVEEPMPVPIQRDNQVLMDDDYPQIPVANSNKRAMGSKTWSSNPVQQPQNDAQMYEVRNDLVASLTPPPFMSLFPPPITLAPFLPPAPPTAPPLAFPTVPSLIMPNFKMPELDKGIFFPADKLFGPLGKIESIIRRKRGEVDYVDIDEEQDSIRTKRDYYDELSTTGKKENNNNQRKASPAEDYYGSVIDQEEKEEATEKPSPLRKCVDILGLRG